MAMLRDCGFDFTRLSNEIASQDAELPSAELVANLRADVLHHWTPPVSLILLGRVDHFADEKGTTPHSGSSRPRAPQG